MKTPSLALCVANSRLRRGWAFYRTDSALKLTFVVGLLAASILPSLANRQPVGANDPDYIAFGQQLQTNVFGRTVGVAFMDQTKTNYLDVGALTNSPARFYRISKN
jgi:hypothetical protein